MVRYLLSQIIYKECLSNEQESFGMVLSKSTPFKNVQHRMRGRRIYNNYLKSKLINKQIEETKIKKENEKKNEILIKKERKLRQFKANPAPKYIRQRAKPLSALEPKSTSGSVATPLPEVIS